jgi:hypothetical protein
MTAWQEIRVRFGSSRSRDRIKLEREPPLAKMLRDSMQRRPAALVSLPRMNQEHRAAVLKQILLSGVRIREPLPELHLTAPCQTVCRLSIEPIEHDVGREEPIERSPDLFN